ncbi:MAG TPA: TolC family protein [Thermoanaerobaculia bacterium]|nr:TolC family protein [Thermoanaerobaculia bacterium]
MLVVIFTAASAQALQPLAQFFAAARNANTDARRAALTTVRREADALAARGELLPSLAVNGTYTRNQYASSLSTPAGTVDVQPETAIDGSAQFSVPLLDLSTLSKARAANAEVSVAKLSEQEMLLEVDRQIARSYFELIGAEALRRSACVSLDAAEQSLATAEIRRDAGSATDLDVARAAVEVERAKGNIAAEALAIALARRSLQTLSCLVPEENVPELEADDLRDELPLAGWEERVSTLPSVLVAAESTRAREHEASAARFALAPKVGMTVSQNVTNPAGLVGHSGYFTGLVTLSWRFDVPARARIRSQDAAVAVARVEQEAAANRARDDVHEAWQRVFNGIVTSRVARSQTAAAQLAAKTARERYEAGAGTQLELIQAQRDLSSTEASRIQADANLALARTLLRLAVGDY